MNGDIVDYYGINSLTLAECKLKMEISDNCKNYLVERKEMYLLCGFHCHHGING